MKNIKVKVESQISLPKHKLDSESKNVKMQNSEEKNEN